MAPVPSSLIILGTYLNRKENILGIFPRNKSATAMVDQSEVFLVNVTFMNIDVPFQALTILSSADAAISSFRI